MLYWLQKKKKEEDHSSDAPLFYVGVSQDAYLKSAQGKCSHLQILQLN